MERYKADREQWKVTNDLLKKAKVPPNQRPKAPKRPKKPSVEEFEGGEDESEDEEDDDGDSETSVCTVDQS